MAAYKDKSGKWYVSVYYDNWKGERDRKVKRGFATKKEALEWERQFLNQKTGDLDMTFGAFVEKYKADMKERLKLSTWIMKTSIIDQKILPYFRNKQMKDIKATDVIAWQNMMLTCKDKDGKTYSPTYLKTIHNQLSAIFNHAVRYYELKSNPAAKAGNMGKEKTKEMLFWTKPEYLQFSEAMMDKPSEYGDTADFSISAIPNGRSSPECRWRVRLKRISSKQTGEQSKCIPCLLNSTPQSKVLMKNSRNTVRCSGLEQ